MSENSYLCTGIWRRVCGLLLSSVLRWFVFPKFAIAYAYCSSSENCVDEAPDDLYAYCVSALLDGRNIIPHMLYGSPHKVTWERCKRIQSFDSHANVSIVMDDRHTPEEIINVFKQIGSLEDVDSACLDEEELRLLSEYKRHAIQIGLGVCAPRVCLGSNALKTIVYFILLLQKPELCDAWVKFLNDQHVPFMACAPTIGIYHPLPEKLEQASEGQEGVGAFLDLDLHHSVAEAALGRWKRGQAKLSQWQSVVEDHRALVGGAVDYNEILSFAYIIRAHQFNKHLTVHLGDLGDHDFKERNLNMQRKLLVAAAEMGVESAVYQAASDMFLTGWPLSASSTSELIFKDTSPRDLPIFRLKEVCVRDLTMETEWLDREITSVSSGRRLELLTMQLSDEEMEILKARPRPRAGRFVITGLSTAQELAESLKGFQVSRFDGLSLFWYSGHKDSNNCPDCAHVEHALLDDMLLDWVAWRSTALADSSVAHIVTNLQSSVGELSHKLWAKQVMSRVAGSISIVPMHPSDVFCFQEVVINFAYSVTEHPAGQALFQDGALHPAYSVSDALSWVRQRIWESVDPDLGSRNKYVMYARQDLASERGRRWMGYEEIANQLGAEVITFKNLGFEGEVNLMRSLDGFLTISGGHHAAALWMKPGSVWIELVCPWYAELVPGHRAFQGLARALGIRYMPIPPLDCPVAGPGWKSTGWGEVWIPLRAHPVTIMGSALGREVIVSESLVCSFAFEVAEKLEPEFAPGGRLGRQKWGGVLERVGSQSAALVRCVEWGVECQSAVEYEPQVWSLLRVQLSGRAWRKKSCVQHDPQTGNAVVYDRGAIVDLHAQTASLRAPDNFVEMVTTLWNRKGFE